MLSWRNGCIHFDRERCCQCGACLAACPRRALTKVQADDGLFTIACQRDRCTGCGRCIATCPAGDLPEKRATESDWLGVSSVQLGWARDPAVREESSSGGVARMLIRNALAGGLCQAAYCVANAPAYPWTCGAYLRQPQDVASIANSRYLCLPACENLSRLESGKLLIVGTHCQLQAMERFYATSHVQLIKIALLCKQQKTLAFSRFMAARLGGGDASSVPISYRGRGWPGSVSMNGRSIPWDDAAALPFGKRLWCVPGCRFCTNPLGSGADLTLADPWKIARDPRGGQTLILVRSRQGQELLATCSAGLDFKEIYLQAAKHSVDWPGICRAQRRVDVRLGRVRSWRARSSLALGDAQRRLYERVLLRVRLGRPMLRILNRLPYLG